jgi:hypothetical protein
MPSKRPAKTPKKRPGVPNNRFRLTPALRAEILQRLKAGESGSALAREFKVTRQAVSLLKIKDATAKTRARLVPEEIQKLKTMVKSSLPSKYGWAVKGAWNDQWTGVFLHRLGEKVANRRLMLLPVRRLFREWFGNRTQAVPPIYTKNNQVRRSSIPKEMRDPDFISFLRQRAAEVKHSTPGKKSPATGKQKTGAKAAKRGRKPADLDLPPLEAWEVLNPNLPGAASGKTLPAKSAKKTGAPTVRSGKHRGSKGSPSTAARKKKKKR